METVVAKVVTLNRLEFSDHISACCGRLCLFNFHGLDVFKNVCELMKEIIKCPKEEKEFDLT